MGEYTGIGWTDHTWNPWIACNKVSEECKFCYIQGVLARAGIDPFGGPIRAKSTWGYPKKWNKKAIADGVNRKVFTCSLSDFFHPGADPWRDEAWKLIKESTNLTWLVLTKRPEDIDGRLPEDWGNGYDNVWMGVTVGHPYSGYRLDYLKQVPAKIKFVSAEPLLSELDFRDDIDWIDWIITGCEQASKEKRRKMNLDWVRDIDEQCREAGIAHYFKQYYAKDENGEEIGIPVTDGMLDGEQRQAWPLAV